MYFTKVSRYFILLHFRGFCFPRGRVKLDSNMVTGHVTPCFSGKGLIRKRGGGKCEGCNVRFENLESVSTNQPLLV